MTDWSAALTRAFSKHLEIGGSGGSCGSQNKFDSDCSSLGDNELRTTPSHEVVIVVPERTTRTRGEAVVRAEWSRKPESNPALTKCGTTGTTGTTDFRSNCAEPTELLIVQWLDDHPAPSRASSCAWCGHAESQITSCVIPFGTVPGMHTWLHAECWPDWQAARRDQAKRALLLSTDSPGR